jgi:hypothetical protein
MVSKYSSRHHSTHHDAVIERLRSKKIIKTLGRNADPAHVLHMSGAEATRVTKPQSIHELLIHQQLPQSNFVTPQRGDIRQRITIYRLQRNVKVSTHDHSIIARNRPKMVGQVVRTLGSRGRREVNGPKQKVVPTIIKTNTTPPSIRITKAGVSIKNGHELIASLVNRFTNIQNRHSSRSIVLRRKAKERETVGRGSIKFSTPLITGLHRATMGLLQNEKLGPTVRTSERGSQRKKFTPFDPARKAPYVNRYNIQRSQR